MNHTTPFRIGLTLLALTLTLTLVGCGDAYRTNTVRHSLASTDRYEYASTPNLPTNIKLVDAYSGDVFWEREIPVGQTLIINLDRKGEMELLSVSGRPATKVTWKIYGPDLNKPLEKGQKELPGIPVMLKVGYRPAPEYPADYSPSKPVAKRKAPGTATVSDVPAPEAAKPGEVAELRKDELEAAPSVPEAPPVVTPAPQVVPPSDNPADLIDPGM